MARLSSLPGILSGPGSNRAQLLLVGAFGLAVLLLVLAGVLNTVTYTESIATQGGDLHHGRDVAVFQEDTRRAVGGIVVRVNANETMTFSEKATAVNRSVANWSSAVGRHRAVDVTGANVTVDSTAQGYRITQTNSSTLVSDNDKSNWTLATGVANTRDFRIEVTTTVTNCDENGCFKLVVDDGTDTWNLTVSSSSVIVDGPNSPAEKCSYTGDPVSINVTTGTVNGDECAALTFAENLTAPYAIRYRNGTSATGTYRLTVEDDDLGISYGASGDPSAIAIVYDIDVLVTYRTPRLYYESKLYVAGGKTDG